LLKGYVCLANRHIYQIICYNWRKVVPPKIRQLKAALSRAGFYSRSAKGSHTVWRHPAFPALRVSLSGKDGEDAQKYQIEDVRDALRKVEKEL
jgi:predicted RNA binding protein YcfA (HicA-like mRNA interferase family)